MQKQQLFEDFIGAIYCWHCLLYVLDQLRRL
jgi:hypothetical protein